MNRKMELITKKLINEAKRNAPTIMSGGAIVGAGLTLFFAIKAKPKVEQHIKEGTEEINRIRSEAKENGTLEEKDTKRAINRVRIKTAKNVAIDVTPAVLAGAGTIGFVVGLKKETNERFVGSAMVEEIRRESHENYVEAAKEVVGEKKEQEIRETALSKKLEETYDSAVIINTGKGDVLYFDEWTNTYFRCSHAAIENAVIKVNKKLQSNEYYVSLNEYCEILGIPKVKFGDTNGWSVETGLMEVNYYVGELPNGEHCIAVAYDLSKKYRDSNSIPK